VSGHELRGRRRAPFRPAAWPLLACVLLGVVVGLVWERLAPTPTVQRSGDLLVSRAVPELYAAQDGVFALLAVAAGLLTGVVLVAQHSGARLAVALSALAGGALGSLTAWRVGAFLGPPPVAVQAAAEPESALRAPLDLHALGVLALWPATTAAVLFTGLVLTSLLSDGRSERPPRP
jgi:hypothetical protein